MSITNNDGSNHNNENNKKSKENLRELSYLIEEERLLADLKRKSEETLQKLKVEELTLLRFVRGLADASGGADKPIMMPDSIPTTNNFIAPSVVSNGTSNNLTSTVQAASQPTNLATTSSSSTTANSTISTIEQNVNNTEVLKLNVDNLMNLMDNDQENEEIEMDE